VTLTFRRGYKFTYLLRIQMLSVGIDTAPQSFCHSFIAYRWYVVRSQPRNPLFRRVKSLLWLWKPHSWFKANL